MFGIKLFLEAIDDPLEGHLGERHLAEDAQGNLGGDVLEVFLTGRDDKTRHVEGTWRDDKLRTAFSVVTIRTVFGAREDNGEELVVATPADDVHHGLRLVRALGQGIVETTEQLFVAILRTTPDEQSRTGVFLDEGDIFLVVDADDGGEVVAEALPRLL